MIIDTAFESRFWSKVAITSEDKCWPWKSTLGNHGYGVIGLNGRMILAHRLAYQFLKGGINPKLSIDHRVCRNKICCNPSHMVQCTRGENILQPDHPTGQNKLRTHCGHGHPYSEDSIYRSKQGWRQCKQCGLDWRAANK